MTVCVESKLYRSMYLNFAHRQPLFLILIFFFHYLMKFGLLLFEENYQLNRLCMLNDSYISSA